ncbi:MAG: hypothetical protein K2Y37_09745 [Pirellulales bacterium]|nr:hypothetical protein [Pirellulales bacterium]
MKFRLTLLVAALVAAAGCKSQAPMNNPFPLTVPPPGSANAEAPLYSSTPAQPYYNPAPGQTILPNTSAPTNPGVPGYTGAAGAPPTTPPPVSTPAGPTYQPGGTFEFRGSGVTPGAASATNQQVAAHGGSGEAPASAAAHTSDSAPNSSLATTADASTEVRTRRGTRIRVVEPRSPAAPSDSSHASDVASSTSHAHTAAQEPRRLDTAASSSEAVDIMRLPPIGGSSPTVRQASAASAGGHFDRG